MTFDPIGPPPKKTIKWTTNYIYRAVVVRIDFNDTSVQEALDFIPQAMGIPSAYRVEIDDKALGEAKLNPKINLQAKNLKVIEALVKVDDMIQAKIVIGEGIIRLIPR